MTPAPLSQLAAFYWAASLKVHGRPVPKPLRAATARRVLIALANAADGPMRRGATLTLAAARRDAPAPIIPLLADASFPCDVEP